MDKNLQEFRNNLIKKKYFRPIMKTLNYCNNDNKPGVEILVQVDNNDKAKITTFVDDKDENNRFKLYAPGVSVKKKMNNNQYPHRNVYVEED